MHILWLKTELLHPVNKGGRIRTYHMLRALCRDHRVTYLTLDDGSAGPREREQAAEYCTELRCVPFRLAPRRSARFVAEVAANAVSPLPYAVARYRSPEMRRQISRMVRDSSVDVVVCDFLAPAVNVPESLDVPAILFEHNVEAMIWQRHAEVATGIRRAYFRAQWRRMHRFERDQCRRFDRVVAVSSADQEAIARDYAVDHAIPIGTGVDSDYFRSTGAPRDARSLVFVGSMDWMPNEDAVRWFVAEVMPRVRAAVPGVSLTVVGRDPGPAVRALARDPDVHVPGSVLDVRPYLARGAVFVLPLRVGGGTRLKVYEAMAMGIPVVSTSLGIEGLPVKGDEHVLIADHTTAFADAVIALLKDPDRAERMARAAAAYVEREVSWRRVSADFAGICETAVALGRRTTPALQTS